MRIALCSILMISVGACGSHPAEPATPTESATPTEAKPAPVDSDYVAPFSAADLREGLPAGTELRLRVETAGEPTVIQHWVFTAADAEGCTIHSRILAEDGTLISDEGEGTSKWVELSQHGQFPAARTTRTASSIDVAAGHFDTWLFVMKPAEPGGPIKRFHFAPSLPGPPVLMEVVNGDTVIMKMELLSHTALDR